jgi:hypothetical protein
MSMYPSATLCLGVSVPRERLQEYIENEDPEWAEGSGEFLREKFPDSNIEIACEFSDWYEDLDDVIVYSKSFEANGYGEVLEINPLDLHTISSGQTEDRQVLYDVLVMLGLPHQWPKWHLIANYS